MKQNDIYSFAESVAYSHIYGNTSTNKTETLAKTVVMADPEKLHYVCFRTKAETNWKWKAMATIEEGEKRIGFGINAGKQDIHNIKTDQLIFCTPSKLINMLLAMKKTRTLEKLGWVLIDGWDIYDANAFAAVGLLRHLKKVMELEFRLVLLSVSKYVELPFEKKEIATMEIPSSIKINYTKETLIKNIKELKKKCIVYPGNTYLEEDPNQVLIARHPTRDNKIICVVDSMKDNNGRLITKHMADLRADSINKGNVTRCILQKDYDKLKENKIPSERLGFEECILRLYKNSLPIETLFPKSHSNLVDIFKESVDGISTKIIEKINIYKLGLESGIFLYNWLRKFRDNRSIYVGVLASCLINSPPSIYGPLEMFEQFVGRNNIETLCNFWTNVTSVSTIPLPNLKTPGDIMKWCEDNNFEAMKVSDLVDKVRDLYRNITRENIGNESFASITTKELNQIKEVMKQRQDPVDGVKWELRHLLPPKVKTPYLPIPILVSSNKLLIYISDVDLIDRSVENLNAFL